MKIDKADYDPVTGFLYYVTFKPNMELGQTGITARMPIDAAVSLTETGDLADLMFVVPKQCRNEVALSYLRKQAETRYVEPRVFIAVPGSSGDAVIDTPATLDMDGAGRIVGMQIQFKPEKVSQS